MTTELARAGQRRLVLECLNGPLDGQSLRLAGELDWGRSGQTDLSFPWDLELGDPQARMTPRDDGWWVEPFASAHGLYRLAGEPEAILHSVKLRIGDVLKASRTYLIVRQIDEQTETPSVVESALSTPDPI